jgi:DUF4097 and DUF4098 domain-containing protein YvlB
VATNFVIVSGDTKVLSIHIVDEVGAPLNVNSAAAVDFKVTTRHHVDIFSKSTNGGITLDGDLVTVTLLPADTVDLAPDTYNTELQITDSTGAIFTALQGKMIVRKGYIVP